MLVGGQSGLESRFVLCRGNVWCVERLLMVAWLALGCQSCRRATPSHGSHPSPVLPSGSAATLGVSSIERATAQAPVDASVSDASNAGPDAAAMGECPDGMVRIVGGAFWMGTDFDRDEEPRHRVAVRSFCMDRTELTVGTYQACVAAGGCAETHNGAGCTAHTKQVKTDNPINCVDWEQAKRACEWFGKRLPTEREWEYAACGGEERRTFSWGTENPEGRSCYDKPAPCPVGSYPPGAFDLHDMSGNVWEWTASWFGPYPDEHETGELRVYRGGSYSRRFPRWMRTGLRNRFRPNEYGAHLGFRCARDLPGAECPQGSTPTATGCEIQGARRSRRPIAAPSSSALSPDAGEPSAPPQISRDTRYDADCVKYKPGRPVCYHIVGGSFADRQKLSASRGCVNRDVGVGYNSICCRD